MMINENEFFKNATLRLCSSLNPDKAIHKLLHYVKDFIPLRGMNLGMVDVDNGIFHFTAWASTKNDPRPHPKIQVPKEQKQILAKNWASHERFYVYNDLKKLDQNYLKTLKKIWKFNSMLIMKFDVEGQRIGGMTVWMDEPNGFTEEHVRLINLLHDPAAIAMSNMLKHQEANSLKEILAENNKYLHDQLIRIRGDDVIGAVSGLKNVMEMVQQVASMDSPVLLLGETGVGKEVIANVIHTSSKRKNNPFVKINCGAIPETLIDSELFGYEKGAFTGANKQKRGKFEVANTGTIFLDEIGELTQPAQVRLLRVLQEKEIERVGGSAIIPIDTRIVCATHRNIPYLIEKGVFREDLWYRLNVFPINIPPLRHRKEDIPALVNHFVQKKTTEMKIRKIPTVASDAMEKLAEHSWPGNVRELENLVERSLIVNRNKKDSNSLLFNELIVPSGNPNGTGMLSMDQQFLPLEQAIKQRIQQALKLSNGKVRGKDGAAKLLQVNHNTLTSKMRKLKLSAK